MIARLVSPAGSPSRRLAVLAGAMALALACPARDAAARDAQAVSEIQVRAAFLFNFAKFVEWQPDSGPIVIGIAGDAALGEVVADTVRGRTVAERRLEVRQLAATDSPEGCHLLFIGNLSPDDASALLARVRGAVLTVGATARFLRDGGMVRIFIEDQRLRFQVNRRQTEAAGVKISSQLLSLAAK